MVTGTLEISLPHAKNIAKRELFTVANYKLFILVVLQMIIIMALVIYKTFVL